MQLWHAIALGIVEGITEFLPISSTGHLILVSHLLGISRSDFLTTFEIVIQLGAVLAVVSLYIKKIITSLKTVGLLFYAFLPSALIGFLLYQPIKHFLLGNALVTAASLIIGGVLFWILEIYLSKRTITTPYQQLSVVHAIIIGIGQSISIIPGVSRSAATMFTGMIVGLSRKDAVEFSFLLAIPTIAAASSYDLLKTSFQFSLQEFFLLLIGISTAFISSLFTIRWFLTFISKQSFVPFAIYRILLGILFFIFLLT